MPAPAVDRVESRAGRCKLAILVFGVLVLGVGLYAYLDSDWKKYELYKLCPENLRLGRVDKCPKISMETYYVCIIVLTYILSILNHAASVLVDRKNFIPKIIDMGYHVVAALLILIGAIVFLVSAEQIPTRWTLSDGTPAKMLRSGKLTAGVLAVFHSLLYGVTAVFVWMA